MEQATGLLDLPTDALLLILQSCDPYSLCSASRSCQALLRLASSSSIHPDFKDDGGPLLACIRLTLTHILRLPPQTFTSVCDDSRRSAKFCVACPLHSLRGRQGVVDLEGLATSTALAVNDLVDRLPSHRRLRGGRLPPYAVIGVCRGDRGTLRFSLAPSVAVAITFRDQLLGLPPPAALTPLAAAPPLPGRNNGGVGLSLSGPRICCGGQKEDSPDDLTASELSNSLSQTHIGAGWQQLSSELASVSHRRISMLLSKRRDFSYDARSPSGVQKEDGSGVSYRHRCYSGGGGGGKGVGVNQGDGIPSHKEVRCGQWESYMVLAH